MERIQDGADGAGEGEGEAGRSGGRESEAIASTYVRYT